MTRSCSGSSSRFRLCAEAASFATPFILYGLGLASAWVFLALLSLPLAVGPLRLVLRAQGAALNAALGGTARLQLVFGLLFAVGLFLS